MINLYLLNDSLFHALGWTIIHSVWQIALIGLLIKTGLWVSGKNSAELRYHLLLAGMISMMLASIFTFYKMYENPVANIDPFVFENSIEKANPVLVNAFQPQSIRAYDQTPIGQVLLFIQQNTSYISLLWLIGFLFFSIRFAGGYWYLSRIKRKALPLRKNIGALAQSICSRFNIKKHVAVLESVSVKVPIALGYLKPAIILPAGLATSIPFNQLEAILTHELAHIKRNDFLVNLLKSLLEAVFFYHPIFWWISKQIENERENCCDDLTIAFCKNETSLQEALLNIELHNQKLQHIAAALYKNKFQLLNRIKRMKSQNNLNHGNRKTLAGLLALPAIVIIFSLSSAFVPHESDLPDLSTSNNPAIPAHAGLNMVTFNPALALDEPKTTQPADAANQIVCEPMAMPDTNQVKYGSKIKTDDGYVLMEFDENMNLQEITKDGKKLTGEERKKYEKIAASSRKAYEMQLQQKDHQENMAEMQEKLASIQERMKEVQQQYQQVWKEYAEKSAWAGDSLWSETYASAFNDAWAERQQMLADFHFEMPEFEFPEVPMPEIPENYFNREEMEAYYREAEEQYEDMMRNYKNQREDWRKEHEEREAEIAMEKEVRALERETRALERKTREFEIELRSELLNDNVIDNWDDLKTIKLSEDKLEVNGERLSKKLHKKYLEMYENHTGEALDGTLEISR